MTQAPASYEQYLADFEAFEAEAGPCQPDWLRQLRREAIAHFREMGLPLARKGNEPWKYTNVAPVAKGEFAYARTCGDNFDLPPQIPWNDSWTTIVVSNDCSSVRSGQERKLPFSLAMGLNSGDETVCGHLARQATPDYDGFVALNTAFLDEGAFIHVPKGESLREPVHIVYVRDRASGPTVSYPRALIVAEPMSELTVIETYAGWDGEAYLTNAVTEIVLKDGARVDHYKLMLESEYAFHVGCTRVEQARDSTYSSLSYARGARIGRNDLRVVLDGPGGSSHLKGLYVTAGSQHLDNYINIDHAKPHCTSRLYYKGILDGESRAVFGGTVLVRPGAVKTDAYQEDKNLLLSEKAEVDSKPSLEIYADDVKCGHGATAGTVTEDAIFYMRSRGLDLEKASALLIQGFASEITDSVRVAPLRAYLERLTLASLRGFTHGLTS